MTTNCQLCQSKDLKLVIDLGLHPLADTFLMPGDLTKPENLYPLQVLLCQNCGYMTLALVVPPKERYQTTDYSYTSSNSPVAIKHFQELAQDIKEHVALSNKDLVVDIGSNDGTLLQAIKEQTPAQILGIEPSANIAGLANQRGIETVNDFFNQAVVEKIVDKSKAKVIVATNVFNHITDLNTFMRDLAALLVDDGLFVFEVPYLLDLVKDYAFDTIYLEHVSYFGVKPLVSFFRKYGLNIIDIQRLAYMGGSIRVYVSRQAANQKLIDSYLEQEANSQLYDSRTYVDFMIKIEKLKSNLVEQIKNLKSQNQKIVGLGAATKGNTLLNYCQLDNHLIDFITDSSPLKIGKYTPGSHIPILSDEAIDSEIKYALILPWNIANFLQEKLKHLNLKFIIPKIG